MKRLRRSGLLIAIAFAQARAQLPAPSLPRRIQLGAVLDTLSDSLRQAGMRHGVRIVQVIPGSAAAAAGLSSGDVLVSIAGASIDGIPSALSTLRALRAGPSFVVAIARAGRTMDLDVPARERPREQSAEFAVEYLAANAAGGTRRVLVTHPKDAALHPAVLIIGGIGCFSIDAPSGPSAYRDLAYHLTRQGYTAIRVEKAGIGDSEGGPCGATDFQAELAGYRAALVAARRYPWVDSTRVFLFGHSIGGVAAALLAAEPEEQGHIRGVIELSTVGIGWFEYELANLRRQLVLQGTPPDSVELIMREKTTCGFHFLIEGESRSSLLARSPDCERHIAYPASDAYMHEVARLAPTAIWKSVNVPTLLLHGASDFVTSAAEHASLAAAINVMHPGMATYAEVPELDHYLSRQPTERASITDPVAGLLRPYFGNTLEPLIDGWLAKHSGQS